MDRMEYEKAKRKADEYESARKKLFEIHKQKRELQLGIEEIKLHWGGKIHACDLCVADRRKIEKILEEHLRKEEQETREHIERI